MFISLNQKPFGTFFLKTSFQNNKWLEYYIWFNKSNPVNEAEFSEFFFQYLFPRVSLFLGKNGITVVFGKRFLQ